MHSYLLALTWALSAFILYKVTATILTRRYDAAEAKRLGCQPAPMRPHKLPFAVDNLRRALKADRDKRFPDDVMAVYEEMGRPATWVQNIMGSDMLATVDPKNIQAILATQFNDFSLGPSRRGAFWPLLGNGIFTQDGKPWEHSRAMMRPQFVRDQVSDLALEELHVQNMMRHLPTKSDGWTEPTDLQPLFFRLTLDSATEFLFGQSVNSQTAALPDSSVTEKLKGGHDWTSFAPAFDKGTAYLGTRGRFGDMYWLYGPKDFYTCCKQVHDFADYYVNLALSNSLKSTQEIDLEKTGAKKERYIFLEALAQQTRDPIELRSQLLNILLAGRDTTAGLLGWLFYILVRHPSVLARLRATVLEDFGTYAAPRDITFARLKACAYLQHCLNETLRLYAVVPVNSRNAVRNTTLPRGGGPDGKAPLFVKKGQEVNYSVHVMHRRKDLWGADADEFRPERWVGAKPGWEYLPFNGGPRICLGQQFALTEASYVAVRLLQRFDKIENLDMDPVVRNTLSLTSSTNGVKIRLHETRE